MTLGSAKSTSHFGRFRAALLLTWNYRLALRWDRADLGRSPRQPSPAGPSLSPNTTDRTGGGAAGRASYHPVMKTSGITAALPARDLGRAKAFYVEKVGLQALESPFLKARDGQVGLTVGDGVSQLFVYPARARSSGEFTQAVIHVTDVRAAVEEMRGRGVKFEGYDTPETRTENGVARMPGGGEAAWFKDSEGNLVGIVPA
jgi:predicted enzyme related to lactoylglutathione lyase